MSNLKLALVICAFVLASCQDYGNQGSWGEICEKGQEQSPINIPTRKANGCQPNFTFALEAKDEKYVQIAYSHENENLKTPFNLSTITLTTNGKKKVFNSLQFHIHHTSEHQIDGKYFDFEIHIVHQAADKQLAVYGMFFRATQGTFADPFDIWNLDSKVDVQQRFPLKLVTPAHAYHYAGSLTTPDCAEKVEWFVNPDPIKIKTSSFKKIMHLINEGHNNNRKIQDLNKRTVIQAGSVCSIRRAYSHHSLTR
jgi:carbonic anhydrase